jgi:hypothetical protein
VNPCSNDEVPWLSPKKGAGYICQNVAKATTEATDFLKANMPPWDLENLETLEGGIMPKTVNLSLVARQTYPWAMAVPKDIWMDWVMPYSSVNEARSDWREFIVSRLDPLVNNATFQATSAVEVVAILNEHLWSALREPEEKVYFKSQQTPMIFDPMSTLVFGYASCTGISILFVDALRAVGVAARLVGTPAWHGVAQDGNHNWVEIWQGPEAGWGFMEGAPAGGGETLNDPCDKWFCNPAHFEGHTQVFASRFNRQANTTIYPLAWDLANNDVPGVNRSAYYQAACGACGSSTTPPHIAD